LEGVVPPGKLTPKSSLDQFATFEVFVQPKIGKPFQHEGIVHAPNLEMSYVLAKEAFTRRFTCTSLYVVETHKILVSPMTEGTVNVYDQVANANENKGETSSFEIYHLAKRGKQHLHVGTVDAPDAELALAMAKQKFNDGKVIFNVWVIPSRDIRFTDPGDMDLWITLPEKKFRDATEYKGGDKLKQFLEARNGK
jgi:ring-1,2-phenylacetyl-CoA epoxidase subunit PaaB